MYLEVGTWTEPEITDHWIAGRPAVLVTLAASMRRGIETLDMGETVFASTGFCPGLTVRSCP
jgi:hypothetical protein